MRITLDVDESSMMIEELLSLFTNYAEVDVRRITYNPEEKWVEVPLSRRMIECKRTIFSKRPRYRKEKKQAILRIRDVENLRVHTEDSLFTDLNGVFTVLFGLKVEGNTIYISSAEEEQGKSIGKLMVSVSSIDIEMADMG